MDLVFYFRSRQGLETNNRWIIRSFEIKLLLRWTKNIWTNWNSWLRSRWSWRIDNGLRSSLEVGITGTLGDLECDSTSNNLFQDFVFTFSTLTNFRFRRYSFWIQLLETLVTQLFCNNLVILGPMGVNKNLRCRSQVDCLKSLWMIDFLAFLCFSLARYST